ncbi:hypothetical protein O181_014811 [Austropuccinia psidii MF-1]|uniref:Uncharacterized protein n=1 Tax=Austropuccinia psidii MF-1 TaxID=1389203 RepID=A0A9Q3BYT4_9BASI|nr:hypothetical protein [Austropuccinia psidii MF-1]
MCSFRPHGQRSSFARCPCEDSFVVSNNESFPKQESTPGPQTGRGEQFRTISPVPSSIYLSTHHLIVNSLLEWSKLIIQLMKEGNGKRTFELGLIVTMSCHPWDSNSKKTLRQLTPGLSGTQWLEDLFRHKQPKIPLLISSFDSSELTLTPFVEPSQPDEPPIPGLSQPSEPHEDASKCEPEPEVAPTQSMEEPFAHPTTTPSVIIINDMLIGSSTHSPEIPPISPKDPTAPFPSSHNEAWPEFMDLRLTLMIPQAIVHESINQILLEHCQLLHMISFMDATH